jgi:hypothetical protein
VRLSRERRDALPPSSSGPCSGRHHIFNVLLFTSPLFFFALFLGPCCYSELFRGRAGAAGGARARTLYVAVLIGGRFFFESSKSSSFRTSSRSNFGDACFVFRVERVGFFDSATPPRIELLCNGTGLHGVLDWAPGTIITRYLVFIRAQ